MACHTILLLCSRRLTALLLVMRHVTLVSTLQQGINFIACNSVRIPRTVLTTEAPGSGELGDRSRFPLKARHLVLSLHEPLSSPAFASELQ